MGQESDGTVLLFYESKIVYKIEVQRLRYSRLAICVSHTAGSGVPDTSPAPEIMYKHARGPDSLTATKKSLRKIKKNIGANTAKLTVKG